jgi:hypothetical protein
VRLGDRAGERALDREDADVDAAIGYRRDDGGEAPQRAQVRLRKQRVARSGAVRAFAAWVGGGRNLELVVGCVVRLHLSRRSDGGPIS